MEIKIALAGNPNCGKTTLFNALTGSNQFVGNWPGVTVEKKEGKLKGHKDVVIMDLPGIYSLSPYTLEEVVARNYLISERPDAILNIIDGTKLVELGIPVVVAINMMDVVKKNGDKINTDQLAKELGCQVCEISALKGTGIKEAAELAVKAAESKVPMVPQHSFNGVVEHGQLSSAETVAEVLLYFGSSVVITVYCNIIKVKSVGYLHAVNATDVAVVSAAAHGSSAYDGCRCSRDFSEIM